MSSEVPPGLQNAPFSSDTFCIMPWLSVHIGLAGQVTPCCAAAKEAFKAPGQLPPNIKGQDFEQLWNSEVFRDIRMRMLRGERIPACSFCYQDEAAHSWSMRTSKTNYWLEQHPQRARWLKRVEDSAINDGSVDEAPVTYDFRPGNFCNLKCRMCSADWSSQIDSDPVHSKWSPHTTEHSGGGNSTSWFEDPDVIVDRVLTRPSETLEIYFAGGETFLSPAVRQTVRRLAERGVAGGILLWCHSNLTYMPEELLDQFHAFHQVRIGASIEGFGPDYEYIRYPAKWPVVKRNLERLAEHPKVDLYGQTALQIYNVLSVTTLLEYFDSLDLNHFLNLLRDPSFLSICLLPQKAKDVAAERLESYANHSRQVQANSMLKFRIDQAIAEMMKGPGGDDMARLRRQFMLFTNDLDKSRRQNFHAALPELSQFMNEAVGGWTAELLNAQENRIDQ